MLSTTSRLCLRSARANLLFYEVPDLGVTPEFRGTPLQGLASDLALSFNETVLSDLVPAERLGLKLHELNTYALLDDVVSNPDYGSNYGITFKNVTNPVWTGNFTSSTSGTLASTNPCVQNQYLFWDSIHPTASGHQLTADYAYKALSATPWA